MNFRNLLYVFDTILKNFKFLRKFFSVKIVQAHLGDFVI